MNEPMYTRAEVDAMMFRTVEACARTVVKCAAKYLGRQPEACRYVARVLLGTQDADLRDPYLRGLSAQLESAAEEKK